MKPGKLSSWYLQHITGRVVGPLVNSDARRATIFVSQDIVITATKYKHFKAKGLTWDLHLKIGRPNYLERKFIKKCMKQGNWPLPGGEVWLR